MDCTRTSFNDIQHLSPGIVPCEPLRALVEDIEVAVGVVLARVDEAEIREVLVEKPVLPDALIAVGTNAVADLKVELLRPRRLLHLRARTPR